MTIEEKADKFYNELQRCPTKSIVLFAFKSGYELRDSEIKAKEEIIDRACEDVISLPDNMYEDTITILGRTAINGGDNYILK